MFSEIPIGVEDTAATNLTLLKPVGEVTISSRVVGFQNKKVVETYQLFNCSIFFTQQVRPSVSNLNLEVGTESYIECKTGQGNPKATFNWILNNYLYGESPNETYSVSNQHLNQSVVC